MALQLLHRNNDQQHQKRVGHPIGDQGDNDRQRASHQGANDGDEAGKERDHGQCRRQWHVQHEEANADADGVDKGNDGLHSDEPGERVPDPGQHLGQVPTNIVAGGPANHGQEALAVFQEEEGEHQHEHECDYDGAGRGNAADYAGRNVGDPFLQECGYLVNDVVVVAKINIERWPLYPLLQLPNALGCLLGQIPGLGGDAGGHGGENAAQNGEEGDEDNHHRQGGGDLVFPQPAHRWPQHGGHDNR